MRLLPPNRGYGWTPYVWLVYAVPFLIWPAVTQGPSWRWAVSIGGTAVLVVTYFWAHWLRGTRILWPVAILTLLAIVTVPFTPNAIAFFIYAGGFLGHTARPKIAFWGMGILIAIIVIEGLILQGPHLMPYVVCIVFTILIGMVNLHYTQRTEADRKLRMAQEEIEHLARVAERERIARDLHDVLGHTLSAIVLKSELASRLSDADPQRAVREIQDVEKIAREALTQVRATVQGYRALGLNNELDRARELLECAGVKVKSNCEVPQLPPAVETVLSLSVREAALNVVRHSGATECSITLVQNAGTCLLEVADNGKGATQLEGSGLTGMRERVAALGGSVRREVQDGTRICVVLPAGGPA